MFGYDVMLMYVQTNNSLPMKQSYTPPSLLIENTDNNSDLYHLEWQVEHSFNDVLSLLNLLQFDVREEVTEKLFQKVEQL